MESVIYPSEQVLNYNFDHYIHNDPDPNPALHAMGSIREDAVNKPWRPIISQRLTPHQARQLLLFLIPFVIGFSKALGGISLTVALVPLIWIYNDLGGADENWLIRNALNAGGLMCFGLGAMTIAADPKQYDLTNKAYIWAAMIGSVVLTTVHSQDLPDMDGDSARGRKTIPLIYGESVARYSVAAAFTRSANQYIQFSHTIIHKTVSARRENLNSSPLFQDMPQLTWLITGCSSGFGEQFVHSLLARGDKVIATGRQAAKKLAYLKDTGAVILDLDVTSPQSKINEVVGRAIEIYGGNDVLINNAGYIESGTVEELTLAWRSRGSVLLRQQIRFGRLDSYPVLGSWFFIRNITCEFSGVVECLAKELAIIGLGIKPIIFEPGFYRTQALSPKNIRHETPTLSAYAELNEGILAYEASAYGNEPGDPKRAVERMIEVVKGDGMAAGKTMPLRMPLGTDGLKVIKDKCEDTLRLCDEWKDVAISTDLSSSS
ncbi:hypothetical protein MMC14_005501 [Varicellaria rhodocarpa]|nr:hypothetical protein [Varicellaria rhodocarpa]